MLNETILYCCKSFNILCSTDFVVTGSVDGHVKFWKKQDEGIEFVKHFRCHLGNIQCLSTNHVGTLLCSVSNDKSIKVFDVVNFGKYVFNVDLALVPDVTII